jgi:TRAP-type mannitol/chloroaromatic compound transport system substrate-binding protein
LPGRCFSELKIYSIGKSANLKDLKMTTTDRRQFLAKYLPTLSVVGGAVLALDACTEVEKDTAVQWRLRTSWQKDMPGFFEAAERLAKRINHCCAARLRVTVVAAESNLDAFTVFDEVAAGRVEMAHTSAGFWRGKSAATAFFASLPFGMTASESTSWILAGEGWALWRELYANFGLVPFPVGNTGAQMAGWFKRELKSLRGVRGLKLRLTGLAAEVWQRVGGEVVTLDGMGLVQALNAGTIDAAEWMGPWNDLSLGLHQAAKNYYYPGWQEPSATLECIVNQRALHELPQDLQAAVENACLASHAEETALMNARNQQALLTLVSVHRVNVLRLPTDVITALSRASEAARAELAARDHFAQRVFDSAMAFREQARQWQQVGDQAFVAARG